MRDLKIMIVGSDKIFAIENFYSKYLRQSGVHIDEFGAYSFFFDYYHKNVFNKIIFKARLSAIFKKINRQFKEAVQRCHPDVIWVFKGMEIFPSSLKWAGEQNIKLVNYNPDNPLIFSDKGSGNKNVTDSISLYDLHLTYHMGVKKQLEEQYHNKVAILPFGFDADEQLYQDCCRQPEMLKACFIGNPDNRRAAFIKALAAQGIAIDIYGNNWNKFVSHAAITLFPPAYGIEQWKVLRRYRVQLNLMRIHNDDSHNMRSFEVPGIGGIMVAPDTSEHRMYFEDGKEVFLYKNLSDCTAQIKRLLAMHAADADVIRLAARERSVTSGYSYEARAKQALGFIGSLLTP